MVLCMYIPLNIYSFEWCICHVVRCVIPFPQRIWIKGEVGGFALFNFTENCGVGGHGFLNCGWWHISLLTRVLQMDDANLSHL